MKKLLLVLPLLLAAPAWAAPEAAPAPPPERVSALIVYGDDPCPGSKDDEIVVCARQPESERYRIPKALRAKKADHPAQSWTSRVQTLDAVSQQVLPNSCSPIGSNGQTGCFRQFQQQMRDQRTADKAETAGTP